MTTNHTRRLEAIEARYRLGSDASSRDVGRAAIRALTPEERATWWEIGWKYEPVFDYSRPEAFTLDAFAPDDFDRMMRLFVRGLCRLGRPVRAEFAHLVEEECRS